MNLTSLEKSALESISKKSGASVVDILEAYKKAASGIRVNAASLFLPVMRYNTLSSCKNSSACTFVPDCVITPSISTVPSIVRDSKGVGRARSNGRHSKEPKK